MALCYSPAALTTLVLTFVVAPTALPQKTTPAKPKKSVTEETLRTFDATLKKLSPGYTGSSIKSAFRKFRVRPKSEFETTAEYEARAKQLPWGVYAFAVPKRFTAVTYNADAEIFTVEVASVNPAVGFDETREAAIEFTRENERERRYAASNAFGASILVEETLYDSYSVITQLEYLPTLRYAATRARASKLKDSIRVLAVVGLDENSHIEPQYDVLKDSTGFRHAKPTFNDPTEISINDYSLRGQLLELWLFDRASGEILGRFGTHGTRTDENV